MRLFIIGLALLVSPAALAALTEDDPRCADAAFRGAEIRTVREGLAKTIAHIETVPPSEVESLEREEAAIFAHQPVDMARYDQLQSSTFYNANEVQRAYALVNRRLDVAGKAVGPKAQAIALVDVLRVVGSLSEKIRDYVEFDWRRASPLLEQERRRELRTSMLFAVVEISQLTRCTVDKLKE